MRLTKELKALYEQRRHVTERISEIEAADRAKKQAPLVGRTFRYMNSYSGSERWPLYVLVKSVDDYGWLTVFQFQTDSNGQATIQPSETRIHLSDGYEPITRKRFDKAWAELRSSLAALP